MTQKTINKMLPPGIKNFIKEQEEIGGSLEFEFDRFLEMDIKTTDGNKVIISAKYMESDVLIEWYYIGNNFYIKVNNSLIKKYKSIQVLFEEKETEVCYCECHKEGERIRHISPCCNHTGEKYLDEEGNLLPLEWGKALRKGKDNL